MVTRRHNRHNFWLEFRSDSVGRSLCLVLNVLGGRLLRVGLYEKQSINGILAMIQGRCTLREAAALSGKDWRTGSDIINKVI